MAKSTRSSTSGGGPLGPQAGDLFPEFQLPDHRGGRVTLATLRGRPSVVYFYPEADTPVCTVQACGLRDRWREIEACGATVVAVSPDPPAVLAAFAKGQRLPFLLAGDEPDRPGGDPPFMTSIGVWGEKVMYGHKVRGVIRTTFVLDSDGRVVHRWPNVRTPSHAERVVVALQALAGKSAGPRPASRPKGSRA